MDSFVQHFKDPQFLIFGVALGIFLSVIATYFTRFIDRVFFSSLSWARTLTRRSQERQAAFALHLIAWIDGREDGARLALAESNFFSLTGVVYLAVAVAGIGAASAAGVEKLPPLKQAIVLIFIGSIALVGLGAIISGGRIKEVLRSHPKGLKGMLPKW